MSAPVDALVEWIRLYDETALFLRDAQVNDAARAGMKRTRATVSARIVEVVRQRIEDARGSTEPDPFGPDAEGMIEEADSSP